MNAADAPGTTHAAPTTRTAPVTKSLVYMGSFMPYKNVETMLSGMAGLAGYTLHLLSRITPQRRAELEALVPEGANVVFHNGVTDDEYTALLKRTTALVSLSKAEGYGLPLVEAMALGTPVIASAIPIFREVGGDVATYVDPESADAFAAAVRGLGDGRHWQDVSRRSVERANEFSWEASARQLVDVAAEVMALRAG
jgi:glycosyltransferase involved in cell wall biosynthesis